MCIEQDQKKKKSENIRPHEKKSKRKITFLSLKMLKKGKWDIFVHFWCLVCIPHTEKLTGTKF